MSASRPRVDFVTGPGQERRLVTAIWSIGSSTPILRLMPKRVVLIPWLLLLTFGLAGSERKSSGPVDRPVAKSGNPSTHFLSRMKAAKTYLAQCDAPNALPV